MCTHYRGAMIHNLMYRLSILSLVYHDTVILYDTGKCKLVDFGKIKFNSCRAVKFATIMYNYSISLCRSTD